MIQVANLADSLAAIKALVYDRKSVTGEALQYALEHNFAQDEMLQQRLLNKVDKYGNDVEMGGYAEAKWASAFRDKLRSFTNYRKGPYHTGMYTVVPMCRWESMSVRVRMADWPVHRLRMAACLQYMEEICMGLPF